MSEPRKRLYRSPCRSREYMPLMCVCICVHIHRVVAPFINAISRFVNCCTSGGRERGGTSFRPSAICLRTTRIMRVCTSINPSGKEPDKYRRLRSSHFLISLFALLLFSIRCVCVCVCVLRLGAVIEISNQFY